MRQLRDFFEEGGAGIGLDVSIGHRVFEQSRLATGDAGF
jgi:hypothetical protein